MANDQQLFDLTFLKKFTHGDVVKVERYIQTYLRTSGRIFNELKESCNGGQWEDVYIKAHTVKPQVQYMGINSLQEAIQEIENLTRKDPGNAGLKVLVASALEIYRKSAIQLEEYLESLAD